MNPIVQILNRRIIVHGTPVNVILALQVSRCILHDHDAQTGKPGLEVALSIPVPRDDEVG
jgi:hypothetical protein